MDVVLEESLMIEISKHNLVCLERGDIDYLKYVADQLSAADSAPSAADLENYAEALRGIARAVIDLRDQ